MTKPDPMDGYDLKQLRAVLKACVGCGKAYYFTNPQQDRCRDCQERKKSE